MVVKPKPGKVYNKSVSAKTLANLKPLNELSAEKRFAIQSKGGKGNKNNPKQSLAAKLRWIKRRGMSDKEFERLYKIMTNPEASGLDIRSFIEGIKKTISTPSQQISLTNSMIAWHKMMFGEKHKTEITGDSGINIIFNADFSKYKKPITTIEGKEIDE